MFDIRKIQEQVIYAQVEKQSGSEIADEIIGKNAAPEDNANWVKNTMARLETQYDRDTLVTLRRNYQCGYGMDEKLELLKELMQESDSIETLASQAKAQSAGLSSANGKLYLMFPFCPCPMLADVDKLATDTWCQCTTGYSKVLFEKAFGCDLEVILLKSIKMGNDICLMEIIPVSPIQWNHSK